MAEPSRRNSGFEATSNAAVRSGSTQDRRDLAAGADRHRRFRDDDRVIGHRLPDFLGCRKDIGEVGMAVAAPRGGADRDKHGLGPGDRRREVGGERNPAGRRVFCHQGVEPGLENRHFAAAATGRSWRHPGRRKRHRRQTRKSTLPRRARHSLFQLPQCAYFPTFTRMCPKRRRRGLIPPAPAAASRRARHRHLPWKSRRPRRVVHCVDKDTAPQVSWHHQFW